MAGAAIPEGSGGRGKQKALDAVINLVPFIDLLSCCLAFLLITAVWTQVSKLGVQQSGPADSPSLARPPLEIRLSITEAGYRLSLPGGTIDIARTGARYDLEALFGHLKELKDRNPEQRTISVISEDGIQYDDLVHTIDTCMKLGLDSVSVQSAT